MDSLDRFDTLVAIMDRLREPDGCPWDHEQDYRSLRGYLIEESYEVAEAIDADDHEGLREELGDLLFQIVFLSRIAKEESRFTVRDVIRGIAEKMIRRHPHVFGAETVETADDVVRNWEAIKRREKGPAQASHLDGIPRALPALLKAQRLGDRAAKVGFDWDDPAQVIEKVEEECAELKRALSGGDREAVRAEIGDLLFSVAMLARQVEVEAEGALERTNRKFRTRFAWIEDALRREGVELDAVGIERLESLWAEAKRATGR